jgi:hypothetical protein
MLCEDGVASRKQQAWVAQHESVCPKCADEHLLTLAAMTALRAATIEPEPDPSFESRFIRRWRVESRRRAVTYWMPAIAGAVVAGVALLAVLQILLAAPSGTEADIKNREAANGGPSIPDYGETITFTPSR